MIFEWLRGRTRNRTVPSAPPDTRVYTIGDIHGRADLLASILMDIDEDRAGYAGRQVLIFLGDYMDRGLNSRAVLDALIDGPFPGYDTIFLKGNHDAWLLQALDDSEQIPEWLESGGLATLLSYGVDAPPAESPEKRARAVQEGLRAVLPAAHRQFLAKLRNYHVEGDYLFVHAGIRPGVPLDDQREEDLCWIRDEFLHDTRDYGYCVVHGHSMSGEPERQANRIGVDTGAYATGRLSCLVLEGREQRFLHT